MTVFLHDDIPHLINIPSWLALVHHWYKEPIHNSHHTCLPYYDFS